MANFFEVTDPRGYLISCTEERWFGQILVEYPEMEDAKALVIEAIRNPRNSVIYWVRDFPDHHIYYTIHLSGTYYVKAVVGFSTKVHGQLITAFMPDSLRRGETPLWTAAS